MFLCMDEYGRIYQASRDREDGTGFEVMPEQVTVQDVTLQNTALDLAKKTKKSWDSLARLNAVQDSLELQERFKARNEKMLLIEADKRLELERLSPAYQNELISQAAIQTLSGADFSQHSLWGNSSRYHADGMGRTRDQKLAELAWLRQSGKVPPVGQMAGIEDVEIPSVDQEEIEQYQLQVEADAQNEANALQAIVQNEQLEQVAEASEEKDNKMIKNLSYALLGILGYNLVFGKKRK